MPKAKNYANKAKPIIIKRKFRVGGRKGGKGAHSMKTDELLAAYNGPNNNRSKNKIAAVLRKRGVTEFTI